MTKPTAAQIVTAAVNLLRGGTLPSVLPGRLMDDFSLSPEQARELAGRAVRKWQQQTRPRGQREGPGE